MGRTRKPAEILERNGAYDKNPNRRRAPSPKSNNPVGDPPEHLDENEAAIWREVAFEIPDGVLTEADRCMFGMFCQLESKVRTKTINHVERGHLIKLYSSMGLTPADRTRISLMPPEPTGADVYAEFVR